jgi:hypothetical protein
MGDPPYVMPWRLRCRSLRRNLTSRRVGRLTPTFFSHCTGGLPEACEYATDQSITHPSISAGSARVAGSLGRHEWPLQAGQDHTDGLRDAGLCSRLHGALALVYFAFRLFLRLIATCPAAWSSAFADVLGVGS